MTTGYITEIFSSLQGEGPHMGEREIFIRLAGCPWRCDYCDTPDSLTTQGAKQYSVEDVLDEVHHLQEERRHGVVSLTGGEPLNQAPFLSELLPLLRRLGLKTYLETSGTAPELLRRVIDHCDVVAMDIKLPSAIGREFWKEHKEFLAIAGKKAFVKVVLTNKTTEEEVRRAMDVVSSVDPSLCFVLQPVTATNDLRSRLKESAAAGKITPPDPKTVARWWGAALEKLSDARLLTQMHPIWGLP